MPEGTNQPGENGNKKTAPKKTAKKPAAKKPTAAQVVAQIMALTPSEAKKLCQKVHSDIDLYNRINGGI